MSRGISHRCIAKGAGVRVSCGVAVCLALAAGAIVGAPAMAGDDQDRAIDATAMVRYDGHRLARITPRTQEELSIVFDLSEDGSELAAIASQGGLGTFELRFAPRQYLELAARGIEHEVLVSDVQAYIDQWREKNELLRGQDSGWYTAFRDLGEIEARMDSLAAAHPTLATLSTIGESIEGRPIRMLRITGPGSTEDRPAILIDGTLTPRFMSPMTTMFHAEQLLERYATDPQIAAMVDGIDFHFIPMANPDGYVYMWDVDPFWSKNRRDNSGSPCFGVHLNRNWSYQWGQTGSSADPCSATFRGEEAFSEPEAAAIRDVATQLASENRLRAHLSVSSGSLLTSVWRGVLAAPWSHTWERPPGSRLLEVLGLRMSTSIRSHRNEWYREGQWHSVLYSFASGTVIDYMHAEHSALSWILVVGTSSMNPPTEIVPAAEETFLGLRALAETYLPPLQIIPMWAPTSITNAHEPRNVMVAILEGQGRYLEGSAQLLWRLGESGPFFPVEMVPAAAPFHYTADLPAGRCGEVLQYYIEARTVTGQTVHYPEAGPADPLAPTAYELQTVFFDDFEQPSEWTVWNDPSLTSGGWERAIPVGTTHNGVPAAPGTSYSGQWCFVTQNAEPGAPAHASNVEGGPTILTSPRIDISDAAQAHLSFAHWHYSSGGVPDLLQVDTSSDDGLNWSNFIGMAPSGQWFGPDALIVLTRPYTSTYRVRFRVEDNPPDSLTESAIDDVTITAYRCPCYANCDRSTTEPILTVDDFTCFINNFAHAQTLPHEEQILHYANCDNSTEAPVLTVDDFTCFMNAFAAGCP